MAELNLKARRQAVRVIVRERVNNQSLYEETLNNFPIVFGRSKNCHVPLANHSYLSASHGCIYLENNQLVVMDLNSRNGIAVGGQRVTIHRFDLKGEFSIGMLSFSIEMLDLPVEATRSQFTAVTRTSGQEPALPPLPKMKATGTGDRVVQQQAEPQIRELPRTAFSDIEPNSGQGLRAVLFWQNDVFDVRQYLPGDLILIGNNSLDPLVLPTFNTLRSFGAVTAVGEATLKIPHGMQFDILSLQPESAKTKSSPGGDVVHLRPGSQVRIELGHGVRLQMGFAEVNRPFLRRTWIENKEEFKNAVRISSVLHSIICLLALFGTPKPEAPKIPNMPPRFAKLLVSPPKQIFPAPPPLAPKPEPKREEPKPQPKAVKAKTKPNHSKPNKMVKPSNDKPVKNQSEQMLDAFNSFATPSPTAAVDLNKVKVDSSPKTNGFSTNNMIQTLKSKSGKLSQGGEQLPMMKGANAKFKGVAGNAGQRDVKGQVVGRASFGGKHGPQGLTDREVMAVVNKNVAAIQQCYERALLDNASLAGRVEYEWTINPAGSVADAQVKKSEISAGDALNECVLQVLKGIQFPAAKNGLSTVVDIGFPFGRN